MGILTYKEYQGHYEYDQDANIFHGEVINLLKDVVTFQARNVEELEQALAESVENYLELCAEAGKAPDVSCP